MIWRFRRGLMFALAALSPAPGGGAIPDKSIFTRGVSDIVSRSGANIITR